jgi:cytochrome P450
LTKDEPSGEIDDIELPDEIVTLLFADHETTSSATAWTLYRLDCDSAMRHDVQDQALNYLPCTSDPEKQTSLELGRRSGASGQDGTR